MAQELPCLVPISKCSKNKGGVMKYPIFSLLLLGLVLGVPCSAQNPPKPLTPSITDISGDAGNNLILKWKHFETVPGILYEIYRSEDGKDFELLSPLQLKIMSPVWENEKRNDVSDWGFYLIPSKSKTDRIFDIQVVKPDSTNLDSLIALGAEKIVRVEFEVPPAEKLAEIPNYFANGTFFQVIPDEEIAHRPQPSASTAELFTALGMSIPVKGKVGLEISANSEEFDFVKKGNRIVSAESENPSLLAKYGKKITSIVTEKARYTVKYEDFAFPDRSTQAGKKYIYKIRLYQVKKPIKKVYAESDTISTIPKDEPPFAPTKTSALLDTSSHLLVLHFAYDPSVAGLTSYFDDSIFVIYKTDMSDTLCENGKKVSTVNSSWKFLTLDNVKPDDAFYIEVFDKSGQSAKTSLIKSTITKFEEPPIPPNLRVKDYENDNGKKIAVRWDPPTLAVGYTVGSIIPNTKIVDVSDKNFYLVHTQNGDTVVQITDTTSIPQGAQKILTLSYSLPGNEKDLKIEYKIIANPDDKALYPEFTLDGIKKVDKDATGILNFNNIETKKYEIEGWIISKSGGKLKNPESRVKMTVDATRFNTVPIDIPPYKYLLYRGTDPKDSSTFKLIGVSGADSREIVDAFSELPEKVFPEGEFYYFVQVVGPDGAVNTSEPMGPIAPKSNWFNWNKVVVFIATLVLVVVALFFFYHAKKGKEFYIRPIAGIVHIDEALGRATEMGKPIVYVTGLGVISDLATLASITILGRVAKKCAEYQSKLIVPCYDPIIMIVAQETVKNAYIDEGRPDLYREENIYYIAAQQFAYAAAVSGLMIREKSAANFFIGKFYAESLILAETGASTGAIQVAGTDDMTQLPFFITACDYTIIGEELYAASAYLSNDPMQKGSLKAQDFLKVIEIIILIGGVIAATSGLWWIAHWFQVLGE